MAKFDVTLEDGRVVGVYAPDESTAFAHIKVAEGQRMTNEVVQAQAQGREIVLYSAPVSAVKVKD